MGIREAINKNRYATAGAAAAMTVLALAFVMYRALGWDTPAPKPQVQAWYTTDDGATYFADDMTKVAPFSTPDGKVAVKAFVYQCGDGKPFVNHLERNTDEAKKLLEGQAQQGQAQGQGNDGQSANPYARYGDRRSAMAIAMGMEVKKPGQPNWAAVSDAKSLAITTPVCPDGSTQNIKQILP